MNNTKKKQTIISNKMAGTGFANCLGPITSCLTKVGQKVDYCLAMVGYKLEYCLAQRDSKVLPYFAHDLEKVPYDTCREGFLKAMSTHRNMYDIDSEITNEEITVFLDEIENVICNKGYAGVRENIFTSYFYSVVSSCDLELKTPFTVENFILSLYVLKKIGLVDDEELLGLLSSTRLRIMNTEFKEPIKDDTSAEKNSCQVLSYTQTPNLRKYITLKGEE